VDFLIDPKTINTNFKIVDLLVRAIFIKKYNANRAVKIFSNLIRNVVINPNEGASFIIIIIKPNKIYKLFNSRFI